MFEQKCRTRYCHYERLNLLQYLFMKKVLSYTCECVPGVIRRLILNRVGRDRINFTRIDRPISVAIEQCGIVGVNVISIRLLRSSTWIKSSCETIENKISEINYRDTKITKFKSKLFPEQLRVPRGTLDVPGL